MTPSFDFRFHLFFSPLYPRRFDAYVVLVHTLSQRYTLIFYIDFLNHSYHLNVAVRDPKYIPEIHADLNAFVSFKMS